MTLQAKLQLGKILFVKCFTTFSKAKLSLANCLSRETNGTHPHQHTQQETIRVLLRGNTPYLVACLSIGPSGANLNFMNSLQTTELGLIAYKLIPGAVTLIKKLDPILINGFSVKDVFITYRNGNKHSL